MGVLYVLDEPSIGLHQRDNRKLIDTLISMRDLGNTVIVVEHDEETIRSADWVIDLGPGAGAPRRAASSAEGPPEELATVPGVADRRSTSRASWTIPIPERRRAGSRQGDRRARRARAQPAGHRRPSSRSA